MKDSSPKLNADESTLIKPYEELEKSGKTPLRGTDSYPLLEIVHGPKQGAWFTIAYQREVTLGRGSTNSIVLEDNSVSRSHAVIQSSGEGFTIRDIGSRNGTLLNSKKIQGEVPLNHMDALKIGIYTLRFLAEPTDQAFASDIREEYTPHAEDEAMLVSASSELPKTGPIQESTMHEEAAKPAAPPQIPSVAPTSRPVQNLSVLLAIVFVIGVVGYVAHYFGAFTKLKAYLGRPAKIAEKVEPKPPMQVMKPELPTPAAGQGVPIILEADAIPIPAKVYYQGKELGLTPFKISLSVPVAQLQELSAEFPLEGIGEKYLEKTNFQVQKQDELVSIKFQPKLGVLKVSALPKNGELYLEGKYEGAAEAKSLKLTNISFNKPAYLPYGKYVAEVRVPEPLEGSSSVVNAIKYRREFDLGSAAPEFMISASDETLQSFPAKINSTPPGAALLVDGKQVGVTPFEGNLPTGRHKLVLKKEGFNEFEKELNIELNTPYVANYSLMTTAAGEFINKGRDLIKKGQFNEAIEQFAEALKLNPEPTELSQIHILLGDAFTQTKTYDQALAYYQRAHENPEYATRADLGMAEAYAGLGQKDQALIRLVDIVINTRDEKNRSDAETIYHKIAPMKSVLYVATQPVGASVTVNGNPIGQVTPVILSDLLVGSYRISIQKDGFKPYETRVSLPLSAIKPLIVNLEAQP